MKLKQNLTLLLLLSSLCLSAQINRAYYELVYKPNKVDTLTEQILQVLIFDNEKSSFQSHNTLKRDSIFQIYQDYKNKTSNEIEINNPYFKLMNNTYKIKNVLNQRIDYKDIIGGMLLSSFTEKVDLKWNLSNETKLINNISCQKATVKYGGRDWVAWFSTDYSNYPFGPYKFYGLPGLIIKVYDEQENFIWKLIGIQKQVDDNFYDKTYFEIQGFKVTELSKNKFKKMQKFYKENPLGNIKETFPNASGEKLKQILEYQRELRQKNTYFNNDVELD